MDDTFPDRESGAPALRDGYTTGTAATAAAMAALELLFTGACPRILSVPLPPVPLPLEKPGPIPSGTNWLQVPIACADLGPAPASGFGASSGWICAHAGVVKDGGDDPDATHGLLIYATLMVGENGLFTPPMPFRKEFLEIRGGSGIGKVTRPGLSIPPGQAAINPVPRQQMLYGISCHYQKLLSQNGPMPGLQPPFTLILSVPGGEKAAQKTLNPKLGIEGGISILGTRGIVRPFSNRAWAASLAQEIAFAQTAGIRILCLGTGRRSSELLQARYAHLPPEAFILAGDLVVRAIKLAGSAGFEELVLGCFFGKLCKLSQGLYNTHAHRHELDLQRVARLCAAKNASCAAYVKNCLTARDALEAILRDQASRDILEAIMLEARKHLQAFSDMPVRLRLFHEHGHELASL